MGFRALPAELFSRLPKQRKILLPHLCNDIGAWGKGFTASIDLHWPMVGEHYKEWLTCLKKDPGTEVLGKVLPCTFNNILVISMVAQHGVFSFKNQLPIRYGPLVDCMRGVARLGEVFGTHEICCPKFGAGLARGNWNFIEALIKELWVSLNFDVTVFKYGDHQ